MKRTGLILLLAIAVPLLGWSQAAHKAVTSSQGGGASTGGIYSNFAVVGQQVQTVTVGEFGQNQNPAVQTTLSIGFLQAAAANPVVVPPCLVPFGLQVSHLGLNSATIGWSAVAGATYEYRYRELASANFEVSPAAAQISSAELIGLLPGTDYIFQLRRQCAEEDFTDWTEEFRFKTLGNPPCEAPSTVSVAIASNAATVSWLASPTVPQTYVVRYRPTGTDAWINSPDESLTLSRSFTGLVPGVYQVQVGITCSGTANPLFGNSILFEVPNPCTAPALSLTTATTSGLTLAWATGTYQSVNLRYRLKGTFGDWSTLSNLANNNTVISGLLDGEDYEISIQANCGEESVSSWSPLFFARTEGVICQVPTNIAATNFGQNSATISWGVTYAYKYVVQYREKGTAANISLETLNPQIQLNSLLPGRTYVLQVRSICREDRPGSAFSQAIEFTTEVSPLVCVVPTGMNVGTVNSSATITWATSDAIGYEVWFRRINATVWNIRMVESPELILSGLVDGATYAYQVRSICGAAGDVLSAWSPQASFTMPTSVTCTAPSDVSATTGGEGEINVLWAGVSGATNYRLRYRVKGISFWSNLTVSSTSQLLQGLDPGIVYEVTVATVCSSDGSVLSAFSPIQTIAAGGASTCFVPSITSVNPGETSTQIAWSGTAQNYLVRYRPRNTLQWTFVETSNNIIDLPGLLSGTTYQYQVRSTCSANLSSDFTTLAEFTTPEGALNCTIPVLATNASATNNSISISWDVASGALGYNVQFRMSGTNIWTTRQTSGTSFTASSLQPGTTYQFRVQSICDEDATVISEYSAIRSFSTSGIANCLAPTAITVDATVNSTATITWTNATGGQYYQVRYREVGQLGFTLVNSALGANSLQITGLKSGATYEYQVRTICDADNFQASTFTAEAQFTTPGLSCLVPVPQIVGEAGVATTISWQMPEGGDAVEEYRYQFRPNGALTWTIDETDQTSITLNSLATGVTYQFRVQARCSVADGKSSQYSSLIFFTVPGELACAIPNGLGAGSLAATSLVLSWQTDGQDFFDVQYRVKGSTTSWITITGLTIGSVALSNLTPNTEYEWRVRAKCNGAVTDFSSLTFFTTPPLSGRFIAENEVSAANEATIEKLSIADLNVEAFPNPFMDWLNVRITSPMETRVTVALYNMAGQKLIEIFEGVLAADTEQEYKVDGSQLGSGMYLIILHGEGDQRMVKKVIR